MEEANQSCIKQLAVIGALTTVALALVWCLYSLLHFPIARSAGLNSARVFGSWMYVHFVYSTSRAYTKRRDKRGVRNIVKLYTEQLGPVSCFGLLFGLPFLIATKLVPEIGVNSLEGLLTLAIITLTPMLVGIHHGLKNAEPSGTDR